MQEITEPLIGRPTPSKGESELVNHGRSCGRIDGWVGLNCSGPDDYERAFWSRQQCKSLEEARGMFQGCRLGSMQVRKRNPRSKNLQLRNEAALRFASFPRSIVRDPGRLSRVKMNALAGALDSLPGSKRRRVQIFRLTRPMTS